jgi:DNA-binding response OmpR family regulator
MAHLLLAGQSFFLERERSVLGRSQPADIVLPFAQVSRRHAEIIRSDNTFRIIDLGSRNGTFLDGREVGQQPEELRDGSQLVLGGAVELLFVDPAETAQGRRVGRLRGVWLAGAEVWVNGHLLDPPLSAHQRRLLELLSENAGDFVAREAVALGVWPDAQAAGLSEEALDGLVKRLRARLKEAPGGAELVEVRRGYGFRLRRT